MSLKRRLRMLLLCLPLLLGAGIGMPMRPEEIEELMHSMNQQKISYVVQADGKYGDLEIPKLPKLPTLIEEKP